MAETGPTQEADDGGRPGAGEDAGRLEVPRRPVSYAEPVAWAGPRAGTSRAP